MCVWGGGGGVDSAKLHDERGIESQFIAHNKAKQNLDLPFLCEKSVLVYRNTCSYSVSIQFYMFIPIRVTSMKNSMMILT